MFQVQAELELPDWLVGYYYTVFVAFGQRKQDDFFEFFHNIPMKKAARKTEQLFILYFYR